MDGQPSLQGHACFDTWHQLFMSHITLNFWNFWNYLACQKQKPKDRHVVTQCTCFNQPVYWKRSCTNPHTYGPNHPKTKCTWQDPNCSLSLLCNILIFAIILFCFVLWTFIITTFPDFVRFRWYFASNFVEQ